MRARPTCCICILLLTMISTGCLHHPTFLDPRLQQVIDRSVVETPTDTELRMIAGGLTAPTAFCFGESDGTMFIANNAHRDGSPHIFGRKRDGTQFDIYPVGRHVPGLEFLTPGFRVYGPVGGMSFAAVKLYVTHRDGPGLGVVTAFG